MKLDRWNTAVIQYTRQRADVLQYLGNLQPRKMALVKISSG